MIHSSKIIFEGLNQFHEFIGYAIINRFSLHQLGCVHVPNLRLGMHTGAGFSSCNDRDIAASAEFSRTL